MRKTTECLSYDSRSPYRYFNPEPLEYEADVLGTWTRVLSRTLRNGFLWRLQLIVRSEAGRVNLITLRSTPLLRWPRN